MDIRIDRKPLQEFTQKIFERAGMSPQDAAIEAEVLVWANLRGVDSHGVLRIPSYLASVERGGMNPKANYRVEKETPAVLYIEGDHAFGPVVTVWAMDKTIAKAKEVGVCWTLIRNTTHQGAMAYYSLMAAKKDMAGIAIVCSPPNMAPFGAKAPGVHNSPISIAVPAGTHRPLCLDMATSVAAGGKVSLAADKRVPMPLGWAIDKDGNPTTDPHQVGALLPFGGPKGSGLAMMFESLASVMAGNPLVATKLHNEPIHPGTQNSVLVAVNIGFFTDVAEYKRQIDRMIDGIKALPKADGFEEILVPGEPEDRVYEERLANGIPLPEGTVINLRQSAAKMGVELPDALKP
ncbi:MAG: Ldh family oxidoreductase [Chloroflexi bacterium]|nr:Ldh family oxidoreductase [Chloroflexota bacterium]